MKLGRKLAMILTSISMIWINAYAVFADGFNSDGVQEQNTLVTVSNTVNIISYVLVVITIIAVIAFFIWFRNGGGRKKK